MNILRAVQVASLAVMLVASKGAGASVVPVDKCHTCLPAGCPADLNGWCEEQGCDPGVPPHDAGCVDSGFGSCTSGMGAISCNGINPEN